MRKILLSLSVVLLFAATLFISCKRDDLPVPATTGEDFSELQTRVSSSVSGFVTDQSGAAVQGASVKAGAKTTTTNSIGFFEITDADQPKNASFVTIEKPGYFKGIKTWIGNAAQPAFFRIKLIPKNSIGTVSGTAGGAVSTTDNLQINFPASAFVTSAGAAYSGTVTINAKWINPASSELPMIMPGDLRGQNTAGAIEALSTYGMAAVELKGSAGEDLQIAPGKKATMTFPIPTSLNATAPATIPLWSFNETNGLWKQEGSATKSGNNYVGDVSHFSFWNCDVPGQFTPVSVSVYAAGSAGVQALVKITQVSTGVAFYGFTNSGGYVSGGVPNNSSFNLEVFSGANCGIVLHSQSFTSSNAVPVTISVTLQSNRTISVSGSVTDCNGTPAPIASGQVVYTGGGASYYRPFVNGQYSFYVPVCNSTTENFTAVAYNTQNGGSSAPSNQTLTGGTSNVVNFQICGGATQSRFLNFSLGNLTDNYVAPPDTVRFRIVSPTMRYLTGQRGQTFSPSLQIYVSAGSTLAVNTPYPWSGFFCSAPGFPSPGTTGTITGTVVLTEAGPVGTGFVAGNLTGTYTQPGNPTQNVSASFRVPSE